MKLTEIDAQLVATFAPLPDIMCFSLQLSKTCSVLYAYLWIVC